MNLEEYLEHLKAQRVAEGLPAQVEDPAALRKVAEVVAATERAARQRPERGDAA